MTTIQVTRDTRDLLEQRKRAERAPSLDAVVRQLLSPRPTRATVEARIHLVGPALRKMGVTRMRVFGSVAKDTAKPGSDIDLLVDLDEGLDYTHLARINRLLDAVMGSPCDLVLPGGLHPRLADRILAEAEDLDLG